MLAPWTIEETTKTSENAASDAAQTSCVREQVLKQEVLFTLIRTTAAAALLHDKQRRQISFTSMCQYVLSSWTLLSCDVIDLEKIARYCLTLLSQIASCEVANRPGRLEPRVLKHRRRGYKLMQKPRHVLRSEMRKGCT